MLLQLLESKEFGSGVEYHDMAQLTKFNSLSFSVDEMHGHTIIL